MNITLNMEELIEKGYTYEQILQEVVVPQVYSEHKRVCKEILAGKAFQQAQDNVLSGNYTSDDLVVLQKALNDRKRKESEQKVEDKAKVVEKYDKDLAARKVMGIEELDEIFRALYKG